MSRNWTEEQKRAIAEQGDLLVSAAAGAGKTSVLSERIARLVAEGADVDELLVVTYTKAAAAEMKQRIRGRLYELSDEASHIGDERLAVRLLASAAACDRANISTIHSFCRSVLKRNYHEAGIDPAADIADSAQTALFSEEAINAVLEEAYLKKEQEGDAALDALLAAVGGDEQLVGLIKKLYGYAIAKPDPEGWLKMAAEIYTDDFYRVEPVITGGLISSAKRELEQHLEASKRMRAELGEDCWKAKAVFDSDMSQVMAVLLTDGYDGMKKALESVVFDRIGWPSGMDAEAKKPYANQRQRLKDCVSKLKAQFAYTLEQEAGMAKKLSAPIVRLCELTLAFRAKYDEIKISEGVMDYSDLEQLALKVLKNPAIAAEYRARFKHVFIDEYQDINPAQEAILSAVSSGNRFMVGDVKQSIYRFRQAEPAIFLEKYNSFNGGGGRKRIDLNRNFRSDGAVLDSVNLLFYKLMRGETIGQIDYADNAALVSGIAAQENETEAEEGFEIIKDKVELVLLDPDEPGEEAPEEDDSDDSDSAAAEAAYTARRILRFMRRGLINEGGALRRLCFSDFTVLLRSAKGVARRWISVLTEAGIPCVSQLGGGLTDAIEVRVFMDLLRVIDNRRQDIPLLAVMRSHICSFTEEELIHVAADYEGERLIDKAALAAKDEKQPGWSIKCKKLLDDINRWRRLSSLMSLGDFVGLLLDETGYEINCSALYGGEIRTENLNALWETACRLSSAGVSGVGRFIKYMDDASASTSVETPQTPAADAVRLMTIHKSKGLEFNVVFLGGLRRKFSDEYKKQPGIFDPELGIGLRSVSGDKDAKCLLQRAIVAREDERNTAEEMRVLYVAMTRAKHALIMTGFAPGAREFAKSAMHPLDPASVSGAKNFAQWLLGAYFPHGTGEDAELPLECGAKLLFAVKPARSSGAVSNGMSREEFEKWGQEAAFADVSGSKALFESEYSEKEETLLPSKLSVTGLTLRRAEIAERPRFTEPERSLTGAEIGTLTHRLLQLAEIKPYTPDSIRAELDKLTEKGYFTAEEAKAVRLNAALRFFASELGQRLIASPRAEREKQFDIMMPADRLTGADSTTPIMLQGVIDCCFMENGEWTLIDFKTTRVEPNRTAKTVAEQYRRQLELYAEALELLTGVKVGKRYVYMLSADEAVEI